MSTFRDFLADLSGWEWTLIALASWLILAALAAPRMGRAMRDDEEVRQPAERTWVCSDGNMRTAAESADWCAATPGSDAYWLDAWIFGETVPDYVPQGWVA